MSTCRQKKTVFDQSGRLQQNKCGRFPYQVVQLRVLQPEVRVHLRVHPHFVAHVPAHRCRSMVAVDGDRETLRTDLQRIRMPTASEASASVHMLAGGAARIISNDRRSRVRCAYS